jgi:transposase
MTYSTNLSDREWEIVEPLLPKKKMTCPPKWSKRQIFDAILYQLKKVAIGRICRKIFLPIQLFTGIINNGEMKR